MGLSSSPVSLYVPDPTKSIIVYGPSHFRSSELGLISLFATNTFFKTKSHILKFFVQTLELKYLFILFLYTTNLTCESSLFSFKRSRFVFMPSSFCSSLHSIFLVERHQFQLVPWLRISRSLDLLLVMNCFYFDILNLHFFCQS